MWSLQYGLTQLRSRGSAVLGLSSQPPSAQYRLLKSTSPSTPVMRQSKAKRTLWAIAAATVVINLLFAVRSLTAYRTPSDIYDPVHLSKSGPRHPILQLVQRTQNEFQ